MAQVAVKKYGVSIRFACEVFIVSETCYRYQPKLSKENELIADWLTRLTHNQRNWGFGLCFLYLRNVKGFKWNHKRVYRIYRELELNMRIKPKKRIAREKPKPLTVPEMPNEVWSMDFMHDQLENGPEYISNQLKEWAKRNNIRIEYIQPGKPQQNAYIERYNKTVRYDWLNQYQFSSVEEVRLNATKWLWLYNNERPNMALGGITPQQKLALVA